jgi:hypothetical protein
MAKSYYSPNFNELERDINAIVKNNGKTYRLHNILYYCQNQFEQIELTNQRMLYVGVGNGFDVITNLIKNQNITITGVDPYISTDGNDDIDYNNLVELRSECGLDSRLTIIKTTIQEYCEKSDTNKYDIIVINDVLHHMYVSKERISLSEHFQDCSKMFSKLLNIASKECKLIIGDVRNYGIVPLLKKINAIDISVDYSTKQMPEEWEQAAISGGWIPVFTKFYVPFRFKKYRKYVPEIFSDRYIIHLKNPS